MLGLIESARPRLLFGVIAYNLGNLPRRLAFMAMRLYWPKVEAMEGKWTAPPLKRMQ
jgi:hypothetical protein